MQLYPGGAAITQGQTVQLRAAVMNPLGFELPNRQVTWKSSNAAVAGVSDTGLVTAVAPGAVTITAKSGAALGVATVMRQRRAAEHGAGRDDHSPGGWRIFSGGNPNHVYRRRNGFAGGQSEQPHCVERCVRRRSKRHANATRHGSERGHQFARRRLLPGHGIRYGHGTSHRHRAGWDYGSTALLPACRS